MNLLTNHRLARVVIAIGVLAYPTIALSGGSPSFPFPDDCAHRPTSDGPIQLVLGRFDGMMEAGALVKRSKAAGYASAEAQIDVCGRVEVVEPGYSTLSGAESALAEARNAGFSASLETAAR